MEGDVARWGEMWRRAGLQSGEGRQCIKGLVRDGGALLLAALEAIDTLHLYRVGAGHAERLDHLFEHGHLRLVGGDHADLVTLELTLE